MRCQFCGWDNPQGKETCEKCNKPLTNEPSDERRAEPAPASENHSRPTDRKASGTFNAKATVREQPEGARPAVGTCPDCGYTLEDGECPSCGYSIKAKEPEKPAAAGRVPNAARKTTRPLRKGEKEAVFTLTPISEEDGKPEGSFLSYEGNEVTLNRDNTDPKNNTITSIEQAAVTFENGKWVIEDKSEYKTTFVQAARKTELRNGDLILLGNQLYRFES